MRFELGDAVVYVGSALDVIRGHIGTISYVSDTGKSRYAYTVDFPNRTGMPCGESELEPAGRLEEIREELVATFGSANSASLQVMMQGLLREFFAATIARLKEENLY